MTKVSSGKFPSVDTRYKYTHISEAPATHKQVARMLCSDMPPDDIAEIVGLDRQSIDLISKHGPILKHVEALRSQREIMFLEWENEVNTMLDEFMKLSKEIIGVTREVIENTPKGQTPKINFHPAIKLGELMMDRHPSGKFIKRGKVDHDINSNVVSKSEIRELERRKKEILADVIDVTPSVEVCDEESDSDAV